MRFVIHGWKCIDLRPPRCLETDTKRRVKFGITSTVVRKQADIQPGINIANYEMLDHFDAHAFEGLVIDESSILKSYSGKFRKTITTFGSTIPYRLACTATPAPNDIGEIINHAEFLGIMSGREILALFFVQDFKATSHSWRLKGHARKDFWQWLASWCRAFRMPEDLGFENNGFDLPPLNIQHHITETNPFDQGTLFTIEANTLDEQRAARRKSLPDRLLKAQELIGDSTDQCSYGVISI